MRDDPHDIAEHLVQEHGVEGALERATEGIAEAQEQDDNVEQPQTNGVLLKRLARGEAYPQRASVSQQVGGGTPIWPVTTCSNTPRPRRT